MNCIIHKVPNGKLLKVFLDIQDNTIKEIKITGDFFVHPEEAVEELEKQLQGVSINNVKHTIDAFFQQNEIEMVGLTKESLIEAMSKGAEK